MGEQRRLLPHSRPRAAFLLPDHRRSFPISVGLRYKGVVGEFFATTELPSPIGRLRLAATERGLVRLALAGGAGSSFAGWLRRSLPDGERVERMPLLEQAGRELDEYFAGGRREFGLALELRGTPFQLEVWRALSASPYGETRSYADMARAVGRPRAFRAVGLANGANPVALVVPCHRVIAADGSLGGYGGGAETKRRLLALEQDAAHGGRLL